MVTITNNLLRTKKLAQGICHVILFYFSEYLLAQNKPNIDLLYFYSHTVFAIYSNYLSVYISISF